MVDRTPRNHRTCTTETQMENAMKLRTLVEAVRKELECAKSSAKHDGVKFNVKRIELEL